MCRQAPGERDQQKWTVEMELLAQLVEETSVIASDRVRKKPREVPRPDHLKGPTALERRAAQQEQQARGAVSQAAQGQVVDLAGYKHAVGVLAGSRHKPGGG